MKKSFVLFTTIVLVFIFSFISIKLVETNLLASNLNRLKYLHLQATIYFDALNQYVQQHTHNEILIFKDSWDKDNFKIQIIQDDTNSSIYYTSIESTDNSPIRLSQKIIK